MAYDLPMSDPAPPSLPPVVTIDGPAGTGKSSVARELASRLGFRFLDTGAMYRAVAFLCLDRGHRSDDSGEAAAAAAHVSLDEAGALCVDGQPAGDQLRTPDVTQTASVVAQHAAVRERLVPLQRRFGELLPTVTEGRDQGTVVFPDAAVKFFLDATAEERAKRRQTELAAIGTPVELSELIGQIESRDARDRSRTVAPLRPADDAIVVDTTSLSLAEVVDRLETDARRRIGIGQAADSGHE